ncbi:MAG: (2Fe-2S)-binding protein, partial [candidate division NC10 bacterium]|nr:(2Fe-2S)-binding protein [candidate division NC10 bacterium]
MPTFTLNGKPLTVPPGTTVLEAALGAGIEIPHYCYHPGLPVEGSCRMCQVEVEKSPKLLVACATPVAEGMVVRSVSEKVGKARQAVLEFYLLNHPLDCPICDKGGECPLQDYTMRFGPGGSRYTEPKVKRVKHKKIGPYVVFDAERCILCTRCV